MVSHMWLSDEPTLCGGVTGVMLPITNAINKTNDILYFVRQAKKNRNNCHPTGLWTDMINQ